MQFSHHQRKVCNLEMNRKKNSPTIYDIAEAANVSAATVSRVFSNSNYPVSPKTKEQILAIAKDMGYVYKRTPVIKGNLNDVHVLIPDLENPFYMELISGMESALRAYHLNMILVHTKNSLQEEKKVIAALSEKKSAVILSPVTTESGHIRALLDSGSEVVLIEHLLSSDCSSIQFNSFAGGKMAAQYLIDRGLRRIAYLSPALTRTTRSDVYRGFMQAMKENHLAVDPNLICIEDSADSAASDAGSIGTRLCETLLANTKNLPDGICCENDLIAIGLIGCLAQHGIRVPEDISVIGLDNISFGSFIHPQLTTVDQCTREMGALAAELIHANLTNPERKKVQLLLEPRLVVRQSVRGKIAI